VTVARPAGATCAACRRATPRGGAPPPRCPRCGEWLLFAGVHDPMHLEQLHAIADDVASVPAEK
jgi:predicted amidophosphoribosyltransferase